MNRKKKHNKYLQYDFLGELYASDSIKVGKYRFPKLRETRILPDGDIKSFNYMLSSVDLGKSWYHCFCDDYQFERLWNNLYYYMPYILKAKGFISTDFSLYRDYKDDILIWNCYRNRVMAYAMQKAGGSIIPTAGFGDEETWEWCFDGLPYNSVVAITTNGILRDPEAKRLFIGGVDAMVKAISPCAIVVCGKYPEWMNNKYPEIKIIPILSYGQQWNRRCS